MKIERTKNATKSIFFGALLKLYQTVMPFIMRTLMIYWMGVEYLGLNSLFTSILQVLNLAELGVGSAMVFSMYKPIAEDDENKICALLKLYKKYYFLIGLVIAFIGGLATPLVPYLVKSELPPELNIYVLYLFNLAATVASYWLFAYKNALFQAHQRLDVTSKVNLITVTVQYGLQALTIIILRDYYIYLIVALITQVITNIIIAITATKTYPDYTPKGALDSCEIKMINRQIRDLFTAKLGGVILNSADTIVISAFLGLTILAVYQNYFFIVSSIVGLITIVFNSCTAGIGNSIVLDSQEKVFSDFKTFTFLINWLAGWCTICLLCIFQPFMKIWVGESLMLPITIVIMLCIYFYVYEINQLLNIYKDAAGIWHVDRFRPLITASLNLFLNIVMVQFWGLYGVVISTLIATLCVGMPWLFHNLFSTLFSMNMLCRYIAMLIKRTIVVFITAVITFIICYYFQYDKFINLILCMIACIIIPNVIFYLIFRKEEEFERCKKLVLKMIRKK